MVKAYKIIWKDGSSTASTYSNKNIALELIRNKPARIVKVELKRGFTPLSGKPTVWVRNDAKILGVKNSGFVYHERAISALNSAEKKRVVK